MLDLTFRLFGFQERNGFHFVGQFPHALIQSVEQVHINIVYLQAVELLLEQGFQTAGLTGHPNRQLICQENLSR